MCESQYNHPIGKYVEIPEWAHTDQRKLMQEYNTLMWDLSVSSYEQFVEKYNNLEELFVEYKDFRQRKLWYMADYIRNWIKEILDIGVNTNKDGTIEWYRI